MTRRTKRRSKLRLGSVTLSFLAACLLAGTAYAAPGIALLPDQGAPLSTVTVTGQGFCGVCEPVTIVIGSQTVTNDILVGSDGQFSASLKIPGSARPGSNAVYASQHDKNNNLVRLYTSFTVIVNPNQNGLLPQPKPTTNSQPPLPSTSSKPLATTGSGVGVPDDSFKSNISHRRGTLLLLVLVAIMAGFGILYCYRHSRRPKPKSSSR